MRRWAIIAAAAATVAGVVVAVAALTHDTSGSAEALRLPTLPKGVRTLHPPALPPPTSAPSDVAIRSRSSCTT